MAGYAGMKTGMRPPGWFDPWLADPTLVPRLVALWDEGISTSEMGRILGLTKSQVIGKVHRLNLTARRDGKPPEPPKASALASASPSACMFPIGDPRADGFHFCQKQPVVPGKPYCVSHCVDAYEPLKPSKGEYLND